MRPPPSELLLAYTLALGLRLLGIGYLLPHLVEADAWFAVRLQTLDGDVSEASTPQFYGTLIPELARAVRPCLAWMTAGAGLEGQLAAAASTPLACRVVVAFLSATIAPATLAIASRFLPRRSAWVATLLVTFSLMLVHFSQQGRPHGPLAGGVACGLWALLALRERWSAARAAAFGLALCASLAIMHTGLTLLPPLALVLVLRRERRAGPYLAVAATLLAAWVTFRLSGLTLAHPEDTAPQGIFLGRRFTLDQLDGRGFVILVRSLASYEPVLFVASLVGLGALALGPLRQGRPPAESARAAWVLTAYAVPFVLVMGLYPTPKPRYMLPLLPLLAILSVTACRRVAHRRPRALQLVASGTMLVAVALPTLKLVWLRSRPDTLEQAATWVRENVRSEADVVWLQPGVDLPLLQTASAREANARETQLAHLYVWMRYQQRERPAPPGEPAYELLLIPRVERVLAGSSEPIRLRSFLDPRGGFVLAGLLTKPRGRGPRLHKDLRRDGTLVASFAGVRGSDGRSLPLVEPGHPRPGERFWLDVLRAESVGPGIELYRVPPTAPLESAAAAVDASR